MAGELTLDAAHRLPLALATREQAVAVGACFGVAAEAGAGDHVEGRVELSVAAAVEPVAAAGAAGGFDGAGAGERGEGSLVSHPLGIAAGDDELGGADGSDAAFGEQVGDECGDDSLELGLELCELAREQSCASGEPVQDRDQDALAFVSRAQPRAALGEFVALERVKSLTRLGRGWVFFVWTFEAAVPGREPLAGARRGPG